MKPYLLLILLLATTGCQNLLARKSAAMEWVYTTHDATTTYPSTHTYAQPIGPDTTLTLTLTQTDPQNAILDCGNDLRLRIYSPAYATGKANFTFQDINGDQLRDLSFTTTLKENNLTLNALFLYHPTTWEQILIPFTP